MSSGKGSSTPLASALGWRSGRGAPRRNSARFLGTLGLAFATSAASPAARGCETNAGAAAPFHLDFAETRAGALPDGFFVMDGAWSCGESGGRVALELEVTPSTLEESGDPADGRRVDADREPGWSARARAWPLEAEPPGEPQIAYEGPPERLSGRASLRATPFAGLPVRFLEVWLVETD